MRVWDDSEDDYIRETTFIYKGEFKTLKYNFPLQK